MKKYLNIVVRALKGEETDYTTGNLNVAIALLAIPMILELCLESVFAVVDMYFVSKLPNATNAIATVGLTEAVASLLYTLGIGLSVGATAVVSRRIGEKNKEGASQAAAQAILLSVVISIILGVAGYFFPEPILNVMGASKAVMAEGVPFTRTLLSSAPAIILLFMLNGIFRGAGSAAMAMRSLWLASGINIVLCPLLIHGWGGLPAMGLVGAAWATVIGRSIGVCYQLYHLFGNKGVIALKKEHFLPDKAVLQNLISISSPASLQFFLQSGSWIVLTYLVSETGGTIANAGYQIAIRNLVFFVLPAWGLSNAVATLVGQNLGANQIERAERSVWITAKYNTYFMVFVSIVFIFFTDAIVHIYTSDPPIAYYAVTALRTMGYGFIAYGLGMVLVQALNGAGDTKWPTYINIVAFWVIQVPLAWFLAVYLKNGPEGVFWAIPLSELPLTLMAFYVFRKGAWKTKVV
jgi:putative MATE family efflux protein